MCMLTTRANVVTALSIGLFCLLAGRSANAQADEELIGLLAELPRTASASESTILTEKLSGVWVGLDGQYPEFFAATDGRSALYRTRISAYQVAHYRAPYDSATLAQKLEDALASAPEAEARMADDPLKSAISSSLRVRAEGLLAIAREARDRGESTIIYAGINFHFLETTVYSGSTLSARFILTDTKLYRRDGQRYIAYTRDSSLPAESVQRLYGKGGIHDKNSAYRRFLENAYTEMQQQCYRHVLADHPVDECMAMSSRAAEFGVELRPFAKHPRDLSIPLPNEADVAFWTAPTAGDAEKVNHLPRPSYCFAGPRSDEAYSHFLGQLFERGLRDTLWQINVNGSFPQEKPGNWSASEYAQLTPHVGGMDRSMSLQGVVMLRADGVLGFSQIGAGMVFDLRNRWLLTEDILELSFHDGATWIRFNVSGGHAGNGDTNLTLVDGMGMQLKHGDYELYLFSEASLPGHPEAAEIDALMRSQSCQSSNYVAGVEARQASKVTGPADFAGPVSGLPASVSRIWSARAEPVKSSTPPPNTTAYYHLGAPDRLGVATGGDGPFDYSSKATWQLNGNLLTWNWPGGERFEFELAADGARAIGTQNKDYWMIIAPVVESNQPTVSETQPIEVSEPQGLLVAPSKPRSKSMPPKWEVIGFWDYDGADAVLLAGGLTLIGESGSLAGRKWQYQLRLNQHDKLSKRARTLWPVQINRSAKRVCVDAPYPSFSAQVSTKDERFSGVYTFASCAGGD